MPSSQRSDSISIKLTGLQPGWEKSTKHACRLMVPKPGAPIAQLDTYKTPHNFPFLSLTVVLDL
jgi:hypothetical protein